MYYTAKCEYQLSLPQLWRRPESATAKKEDNPEQALKEFRAIVEQEQEKGDWWVPLRQY